VTPCQYQRDTARACCNDRSGATLSSDEVILLERPIGPDPGFVCKNLDARKTIMSAIVGVGLLFGPELSTPRPAGLISAVSDSLCIGSQWYVTRSVVVAHRLADRAQL
jgi:hypothetical protein